MEAGLIISSGFKAEAAVANASVKTRRQDNLIQFPVPELRCFAGRQAIFSEGETSTEIFEIVHGAVMVLRNLPGGRRQILDIAGPGRFIGLTAGNAHDCSATVLRDASIRCHDRSEMPASPRQSFRFLAAMFDEIHRLRDLATSLGRKTAAERLAGFLLAMTGDEIEAPAEMILPMSRLEIADHLGLALETVCRNITLFKRNGFIRTEGNFGVTVTDLIALRQIAAGNMA